MSKYIKQKRKNNTARETLNETTDNFWDCFTDNLMCRVLSTEQLEEITTEIINLENKMVRLLQSYHHEKIHRTPSTIGNRNLTTNKG